MAPKDLITKRDRRDCSVCTHLGVCLDEDVEVFYCQQRGVRIHELTLSCDWWEGGIREVL